MSDLAPHHPCSSCGYPMRGGPICGDCREYGPSVPANDWTRAWERVGNHAAYEAWKAERASAGSPEEQA